MILEYVPPALYSALRRGENCRAVVARRDWSKRRVAAIAHGPARRREPLGVEGRLPSRQKEKRKEKRKRRKKNSTTGAVVSGT